MSARRLPVSLDAQIVPGSFAHAVYHLVGELDQSRFDAHYRNDVNAAPAHSLAMLLRAVLLAYSQGMVSSRAIRARLPLRTRFLPWSGSATPIPQDRLRVAVWLPLPPRTDVQSEHRHTFDNQEVSKAGTLKARASCVPR